ncbi:MAG: hypothetical protein WCJ30_17000 [Deltaproteobacteria bacterium]
MSDSAEKRHAIDFFEGALASSPTARLAITSIDELALRGFVSADEKTWDVLLQNVNQLAHALGRGEDRDDARLRMVSRLIAVYRTKVLLLEVRRDDALAVRDFATVIVLERLIDGTARRLSRLLAEHRQTCAGRRPVNVTAVSVQQTGTVNVIAGRFDDALP